MTSKHPNSDPKSSVRIRLATVGGGVVICLVLVFMGLMNHVPSGNVRLKLLETAQKLAQYAEARIEKNPEDASAYADMATALSASGATKKAGGLLIKLSNSLRMTIEYFSLPALASAPLLTTQSRDASYANVDSLTRC